MVDDTALECNPMLEERFSRGSSARLTTAMQQFWTSFAKTGVPTADGLYGAPSVQWPAGDGAASGGPVMVLGETIGIIPGRKDNDCAVLQQPATGTSGSADAARGVAPAQPVAQGSTASNVIGERSAIHNQSHDSVLSSCSLPTISKSWVFQSCCCWSRLHRLRRRPRWGSCIGDSHLRLRRGSS